MRDLFANQFELERLTLADGEVYLRRGFSPSFSPESILLRLIEETSWRRETINIWGKQFLQPRLIAWYGDPGRRYTYSGIALEPLPWTPLLDALKAEVEKIANEKFNSVLLNYYRDENDSMGFHSDNEKELGPNPVIASLSFGETRKFIFKSKGKKHRPVRISLESGSLLLMKGDTQRNWQHGIEKETRKLGPRVNLTFRKIIS